MADRKSDAPVRGTDTDTKKVPADSDDKFVSPNEGPGTAKPSSGEGGNR